MPCELTDWFRQHRRDLPWRGAADRADPYRVLVAEVMLQQTRVDTVVPYYRRWMERFPTVAALAEADTDEALRAWQGLGYYRRALRLHAVARELAGPRGGVWPTSPDGLRELPGIGPYTAAAVAALAFGAPVVAVDGNVRRVAARLEGLARLPSDRAVAARLHERLTCSGGAPGAPLAEALIELGALVCTPRAPACDRCPLRPDCVAADAGTPQAFPAPRRGHAVPERRRWALVALDGGGLWLHQRGAEGMLPGLWGFPQVEAPPRGASCLPSLRHSYSHFRLELTPALVDPGGGLPEGSRRHAWHDLPRLALSTVDVKVLERLRAEGLAPAVS